MQFHLKKLIACAIAIVAANAAQASETFSFYSGALNQEGNASDTSSFTLTFTTPAVLADGVYQWGSDNIGQLNTHIPPGVTVAFTDGYTTITDSSDVSSFTFELTNGMVNQTVGNLELIGYDTSHYDAYYGYDYFAVSSSETQLQDVTDPDIIGLDYAGHHIPVASGGPGTWTYSVSAIPAVPEPASYGLMVAGLALVGWARPQRSPKTRGAHTRRSSPN